MIKKISGDGKTFTINFENGVEWSVEDVSQIKYNITKQDVPSTVEEKIESIEVVMSVNELIVSKDIEKIIREEMKQKETKQKKRNLVKNILTQFYKNCYDSPCPIRHKCPAQGGSKKKCIAALKEYFKKNKASLCYTSKTTKSILEDN